MRKADSRSCGILAPLSAFAEFLEAYKLSSSLVNKFRNVFRQAG